MKRYGNLYERICSFDNLRLADQKARKGKLCSYGVLRHDLHRERNIECLHHSLLNGTYRTSEYSVFTIHDPKERQIYRLPYFPDRIVHHAIMNVLEPIFLSVFTIDTYSCIKNRGIHGALKNLKKALKDSDNTQYCLKLDVKKFYQSIDHNILKSLLRKKLKDLRLLNLLDEIIDSAEGVPIGNYLSQFFANFYLSYFDHWIKEVKGVKYYFRYADDIVILHSNKMYLHACFIDIEKYLRENLKLKVKENWQVFPVKSRGIDFLGYVFRHTHILLRKSIKKSFCRRASKLHKTNLSEDYFMQKICSWLGWAKHCNSKNLIKKIL